MRKSFEIPASKLNPKALANFEPWQFTFNELAPRMQLEMRPYKLVIYQEGGFFTEHRDSVRGENHIGTLVYILNSEFTGGELVVRQNSDEVSIYCPDEWMAMYGDCPHRIEPVTSGTRVSLIFDLYQVGSLSLYNFFRPNDGCKVALMEAGSARALDVPARAAITAALDSELATVDSVVICLAHLYPVCQADPACLKGGDASLYALLHEASLYELTVIPIVIEQEIDRNYFEDSILSAGVLDLDFGIPSGAPDRSSHGERTQLIIPVNRNSNEVLYYKEYVEHVGNQAQNEETRYLTTGLRVVRRAE